MQTFRNSAFALPFASAVGCLLLSANLFGQGLRAPVAGVLADAGSLQRVDGVMGNFAQGTRIRAGILAAEWAGRAVAARTADQLLLLNSSGQVSFATPLPAAVDAALLSPESRSAALPAYDVTKPGDLGVAFWQGDPQYCWLPDLLLINDCSGTRPLGSATFDLTAFNSDLNGVVVAIGGSSNRQPLVGQLNLGQIRLLVKSADNTLQELTTSFPDGEILESHPIPASLTAGSALDWDGRWLIGSFDKASAGLLLIEKDGSVHSLGFPSSAPPRILSLRRMSRDLLAVAVPGAVFALRLLWQGPSPIAEFTLLPNPAASEIARSVPPQIVPPHNATENQLWGAGK